MPPSRALGALLLGAAVAVDVVATWLLAGAMGPANDLFPRWYGTRAWLTQGLDPYSQQVDEGIRTAMGGAPGESLGAFVFGFAYPGYVALLLAPLALLPFRAAAALWLLLAQVAVGAGTVLAWRARAAETGAAPRSALPALLVALAFPASLANLVFGQFAAVVYGALCASWWLLGRRRDGPGGAALALAAVKPSLALLPVAAVLVYCVAHRRWRVVGSWAAVTGALLGASLLLLPAWLAEFIGSTLAYARVASAVSAAGLTASLALPTERSVLTSAFAIGMSALALGAAVWGWLRSPRRLGDALSAAVIAGAWLVPPLYEWNSVLLLIPITLWLQDSAHARARRGAAVLIAVALVSLVPVFRWPYGSRLLWPLAVLVGWVWWQVYRGRQNVTERTDTSPSLPSGAYAARSASSTSAT